MFALKITEINTKSESGALYKFLDIYKKFNLTFERIIMNNCLIKSHGFCI